MAIIIDHSDGSSTTPNYSHHWQAITSYPYGWLTIAFPIIDHWLLAILHLRNGWFLHPRRHRWLDLVVRLPGTKGHKVGGHHSTTAALTRCDARLAWRMHGCSSDEDVQGAGGAVSCCWILCGVAWWWWILMIFRVLILLWWLVFWAWAWLSWQCFHCGCGCGGVCRWWCYWAMLLLI